MVIKIMVLGTGRIICESVSKCNGIYPIKLPIYNHSSDFGLLDISTHNTIQEITLLPVIRMQRFGTEIVVFFEEEIWNKKENKNFCNFCFNMIDMIIRRSNHPMKMENDLHDLAISTEYYSKKSNYLSSIHSPKLEKKKAKGQEDIDYRKYLRIVEL